MDRQKLRPLATRASTWVQWALRPLGLQPSRKVAGRRFFFDPATDIGLELWLTGKFEPHAIAQCAAFIRSNGVVIDVGANVGVHTVHFAEHARLGTVLSIEPSRSTFAYLLKNVRHLTNVVPLNLAFSDRAGLATLFVASDDAYSGLKDTGRKTILRRESIACFSGDEILTPLIKDQRVDLIKIDVEGLEKQVLVGMRELVLAHKPVIFCEIFGGIRSNPDPEATVRYCVSLGYDAMVLAGSQLVPAGKHSDDLYNYFFLPKGRLTA